MQGSVEVLADSLCRMSTEKVRIKVLHTGVGAITESDVLLASASNAVMIGFNVRPERKAQPNWPSRKTWKSGCTRSFTSCSDEITKAMYGLLEPVFKENYRRPRGGAQVFRIRRWANCRLPRDGRVIRATRRCA